MFLFFKSNLSLTRNFLKTGHELNELVAVPLLRDCQTVDVLVLLLYRQMIVYTNLISINLSRRGSRRSHGGHKTTFHQTRCVWMLNFRKISVFELLTQKLDSSLYWGNFHFCTVETSLRKYSINYIMQYFFIWKYLTRKFI